jgi:hypothetical protein
MSHFLRILNVTVFTLNRSHQMDHHRKITQTRMTSLDIKQIFPGTSSMDQEQVGSHEEHLDHVGVTTVTQGSLSRYGTLAPIKTDEHSWFSQMRTSSPVY